jgi:hypothetical protein
MLVFRRPLGEDVAEAGRKLGTTDAKMMDYLDTRRTLHPLGS